MEKEGKPRRALNGNRRRAISRRSKVTRKARERWSERVGNVILGRRAKEESEQRCIWRMDGQNKADEKKLKVNK